jgi:hypothetical protein
VHGEGIHTSEDCRSRRVCGWGHYCQIASFMERFHHCSQTQKVHISISDLIASLDVEEKAQAKDG